MRLITVVKKVASTSEPRKCLFIHCALSASGSAMATCGSDHSLGDYGFGLGREGCGLVNITASYQSSIVTLGPGGTIVEL